MTLHFNDSESYGVEDEDFGRPYSADNESTITTLGAPRSAMLDPRSELAHVKRAKNAPLIPARESPQMTTWHCGGSMSSSTRRSWRPLGATWREWERDGPVRTNPDDGSEFVDGCVPHWGKETGIRLKGAIEHEMTWAYYRMRKHEKHPQRQAVGEYLKRDALNEKMRFGRGSKFHFWRDLRPPFYVLDMKRDDDGSKKDEGRRVDTLSHPDGELYNITYECAIEYFAERLMDTKSDNGTFNNKVRGVAQVRIPNGYPQKRPIHIEKWGEPTLNAQDQEEDSQQQPRQVDPGQWNPLAGELGLAANSDRMAKCRILSQELTARLEHKKKIVKVPELQRLLLGPHASLPRLAKMEATLTEQQHAPSPAAMPTRGGQPPRLKKRTIFTSSAGFVTYEG